MLLTVLTFRGCAALAELKQGLRKAELVHLQPGEMRVQQSSWVLLKGTLRLTGRAASVPAGIPGGRPPLALPACIQCLEVEVSLFALPQKVLNEDRA